MPYAHTTRSAGNVIASADWNAMGSSIERQERDRIYLTSVSGFVAGAADNTTPFSTALDQMNSTGGILVIEPGLGAININRISKTYAPRIICGKGSWLQQRAGLTTFTALLIFTGTISSSVNIASGATAASKSVTLASGGAATLGIAAGDILLVGKNVPWSADRPTEYIGQSLEVETVTSEVLDMQEAFVFGYPTADSAKAWKITTINDCYIDGLEMRGIWSTTVALIDIQYARNVFVKNMVLKDSGSIGLSLKDCYNGHAQVYAENFNFPAGTTGHYGYGINVHRATTNFICEVQAVRVRHALTTNAEAGFWGGPNNIIVRGQATQCYGEGFDTHAGGTNILFDNVISGNNVGVTDAEATALGVLHAAVRGGGIQIRSPMTTINGGLFFDNAHHVQIGWGGLDATIIGATFLRTNRHGYANDHGSAVRIENDENGTPTTDPHVVIKGSVFRDIVGNIVRLGGSIGGNSLELDLVDNDIIGFGAGNSSGEQAVIKSWGSTGIVTNVRVRRNFIRAHPSASAPVVFYGNTAYGAGNIVANNDLGSNIALVQSGLEAIIDTWGTSRASGSSVIPTNIVMRGASATQNLAIVAGLQEWNTSPSLRAKADLTNVTWARVVVRMNTAASASAKIAIRYSLDESTWAYLDGTSGPVVTVATAATLASPWVRIAAAAKADVFLQVASLDGDGTTSGGFANIMLQVK